MKRNISWIVFLITFILFFSNAGYAQSENPGAQNPSNSAAFKAMSASFGYLENITFEKMKGKERVTIATSKQSGVDIESLSGNAIAVKMTNMFVPAELRKPLGDGKLLNVINVVPAQRTSDGKQWAFIKINLGERVPYSVSQSGQNVLIDFNVTGLESKLSATDPSESDTPKETTTRFTKPATGGKLSKVSAEDARAYRGHKISLDFQDANIKAVLRLLAEEGGITIVSGDDVKGNVTLQMKKVPWDQALDTILDVYGLAKKQMGDVISVVTYERMKKDEADRKSGEEDRRKAELLAKAAEQARLEERGKLRQISIEAKIVEATDEFVRNLGVTWGGSSYNKSGRYSYALLGGTGTTRDRAISSAYPTGDNWAWTDSTGNPLYSYASNYPAAIASPTFGLIFGGANAIIEAQLQALETANQGKIISSPKVTTMDNVKATIKQGQEIPYVTIDKDGNRSITFKEAVLRLDVKPKITPDGTISMEIKATNDAADYNTGLQLGGNPPINKNEVESKIVVQDGDTIVIGGILKTEDQTGSTGVPWLKHIPILGWLFKTDTTNKLRKQLMVFITPKIIKESTVEDKSEKPNG
ncbi:MAG: secretin and TonB N-terminal domain-containing protein [Syntrophaceae bacterium]